MAPEFQVKGPLNRSSRFRAPFHHEPTAFYVRGMHKQALLMQSQEQASASGPTTGVSSSAARRCARFGEHLYGGGRILQGLLLLDARQLRSLATRRSRTSSPSTIPTSRACSIRLSLQRRVATGLEAVSHYIQGLRRG